MDLSLTVEPQLPIWVIAGLAIAAAAALLLVVFARGPAPLLRALAFFLLAIALLNPVVRREVRDPLPGIVAVVSDDSASQRINGRATATAEARAALFDRLSAMKDFEIRSITATDTPDGTHLFDSLERALADVPADRIAGVFLLSDGQIHDAATRGANLGLDAPIHTLLTGHEGEIDRRVIVHQHARFAIVGTEQPLVFRVEDLGVDQTVPKRVDVTIARDGEVLTTKRVTIGDNVTVPLAVTHGGLNLFEITAAPLPGELTDANNRAVVTTDGIRDNLRVLLVSGAPHAGERTWRNILKSDAAVDLVHFTILRPPDKQDGTPIAELALIAFPTRELFSEKIDDFDLIIFDRYARLGVLPTLYFDNIADFVRKGGALLVSSGPEYGGADSLYRTPLASVLPIEPLGTTTDAGFVPSLSDDGGKHPITRDLEGADSVPPTWGRWFRTVNAQRKSGRTLLNGADSYPLLVTAEEGEGRVAVILSDQAWLWARGFEGGGPYVDLLRRLSHWLMRESSLEEEQLSATIRGGDIVIARRSMADQIGEISVTSPTGDVTRLALDKVEDGLWRGQIANPAPGIWRFNDQALIAIVDAGSLNPIELSDPRSTTAIMRPIADQTGGGIWRIGDAGATSLPRILPVRPRSATSGSEWMGIVESRATILRDTHIMPLFAGLAGLLALLGALAAMWYRERH